MSRFIAVILIAILCLGLLTGCSLLSGLPANARLSDTVLFSIDYPGAGYGTQAMCADGEAFVHRDGSIHVWMPDASFEKDVEIAVFQMTPEDYAALAAFAPPWKIASLWVRDSHGVTDGSSWYIRLYRDGDNGPELLLKKGGYMPRGRGFTKMYRGIRQRLDEYGVRDAVDEWRDGLMEGEK